jgi:mannose-6-phosphate isomerase-like protein (cupin superfamily)
MSDFTHRNLRTDVEDSAPKFGFGETQSARFANETMEAEQTGLSLHTVAPGKRQGFAHRHEAAEEVYVVLSGSGRMKLDDEVIEVAALDAIRVSPSVVRAFEAGDGGIEILAFGQAHKGDGELIHDDVWGDS